ncbi:carcinine hydrolase/isopenicillin-N N-acyltransferase family protein [Eudoraea sp.]|uniref:carcinine hydrolase/isopenicillin-N N-acyltransferase family protein n=1 Tax=Eudoraea sp. TaxID=1979955 RepID=UPI003C76E9B4
MATTVKNILNLKQWFRINKQLLFFFTFLMLLPISTVACSVLYYIDEETGKIYVANNEDYWYDTEAYLQIEPSTTNHFARLWYGWDDFAQGGVNEKGLFFDGAVTPDQTLAIEYSKPKGNLGDKILAQCSNVEEAIAYLDKENIALTNAHIMFGDRNGNAVVVEWIENERKLIYIEKGRLIMTNYLLSNPEKGNFPCKRFESIENKLNELKSFEGSVGLKEVGNTLGQAVQIPNKDINNRIGGTLYSTFISLSEMQFVLVSKLDNTKLTKLNLSEEFSKKKKLRIKLL